MSLKSIMNLKDSTDVLSLHNPERELLRIAGVAEWNASVDYRCAVRCRVCFWCLVCGPSGPFCCDHSRRWKVNPKRVQAQFSFPSPCFQEPNMLSCITAKQLWGLPGHMKISLLFYTFIIIFVSARQGFMFTSVSVLCIRLFCGTNLNSSLSVIFFSSKKEKKRETLQPLTCSLCMYFYGDDFSSSPVKSFQMAELVSVFPWSLSHIFVCN